MTPPRRPRGRPALHPGEPSAQLCLNLAPADYDRLHAIATARRVRVQAVIREAITRFLRVGPRARAPRSVVIKRRLGL